MLIGSLLIFTSCASHWSETNKQGDRITVVEPMCRDKAKASAIRQLPSEFDRDYGPAGVPPIDRRDIENRETARCLQDKGFILTR